MAIILVMHPTFCYSGSELGKGSADKVVGAGNL